MGREFNRLQEKNEGLAWRTYRKRINENLDVLNELISFKDLTTLSMDIAEKFKSESSGSQGSALEEVRNFLNRAELAAKRTVN